MTGHEIPVINELLYGMDILSVLAEQAQGAVGATVNETWKRANADRQTDILELRRTMEEVLKDSPELCKISQVSYEIDAVLDNSKKYLNYLIDKSDSQTFFCSRNLCHIL